MIYLPTTVFKKFPSLKYSLAEQLPPPPEESWKGLYPLCNPSCYLLQQILETSLSLQNIAIMYCLLYSANGKKKVDQGWTCSDIFKSFCSVLFQNKGLQLDRSFQVRSFSNRSNHVPFCSCCYQSRMVPLCYVTFFAFLVKNSSIPIPFPSLSRIVPSQFRSLSGRRGQGVLNERNRTGGGSFE